MQSNPQGLIGFLEGNWQFVAALATIVVWFVRLEARTLLNAHQIKALSAQRKEDLEETNRDMERLEKQLDEIMRDIKTLLREVRK